MIEGGYYIKARKIQESEIAFAPPHVREIWDWLIKEANHKEYKNIKRGSCFKSLRDIAEGLKWYVGYRKETYSKSKCEMAMNWLRKRGMITTAKTTRGMIITVLKYDTYQESKNYETNSEKATKATRKKQPSDTIYKNVKNKEKKYIYSEFYDKEIAKKDNEIYKIFVGFLFGNNEKEKPFDQVLLMGDQITQNNLKILMSKHSKDLIKEKVFAMDNKVGLLKRYVSFYSTLDSWCRMEAKR